MFREAALSTYRLPLLLTLAAATLIGCDSPPPVSRPLLFEPNLVHTTKYRLSEDIDMSSASNDAFWVVEQMFGTPQDPKLPDVVADDEDLAAIVSMDHLTAASGQIGEAGRGLYQKHCATCHGVTGDGRGPLAATLNPYPRDYRRGVFKWKSTERGAKPTKEDLTYLLRHGIEGTAMVKIPELSEADIAALVDYTIYLSWRGELERALIDDAFFELDLAAGDRIINPEFKDSQDEEEAEQYEEQWELAEDFAVEVGESWMEAEDRIVEVPEVTDRIIVSESYEHLQELLAGPQRETMARSIALGQTAFNGKIANCSKCHGVKGLGDGQLTDYDDWIKEYTAGIGIKPDDRDALIPLLARGAMSPVNAMPRNLTLGIFRGGHSPEDLYRRIMIGIEGSPMPAATFVEGQFEEDDVWHLINYVRSLQTPEATADEAHQTLTSS